MARGIFSRPAYRKNSDKALDVGNAEDTCRDALVPPTRKHSGHLRSQVEKIVATYQESMTAFQRFRKCCTIVHSVTSLSQLPSLLMSLKKELQLDGIHLVLAREEYAELVPDSVTTMALSTLHQLHSLLDLEHFSGCTIHSAEQMQSTGLLEDLGFRPERYSDSGSAIVFSLHDRFRSQRPVGLLMFYDRDSKRYTREVATDFVEHFAETFAWAMVTLRDQEKLRIQEQNLTAAKKEAEKAANAKSSFLATMSHEIRTPMSGVMGLSRLLLETPLNSEQRQLAELIRSSGETLLEIINNILDFSRIEADKLVMEQVDFDLHRTVDEIAQIMTINAREKGVEFTSRLDPGMKTRLHGDPGRLRQVLFNLTGNAVKFTRQGSVRMEVLPLSLLHDSILVRFEISDTGPGIDDKTKSTLFTAYQQAHSSISREYGGSGLGLSICKSLVEMMQGEIGVESSPGKGSTFWFTAWFGLQTDTGSWPSRNDSNAESDNEYPETPADNTGIRILVAEDNPVNQLLATRVLEKNGFDTEVVTDGQQAIEALKKRRYQLVLMDIEMPVMDGLTAVQKIRSGEIPGINSAIPIIALTAHAIKGDKERFLEAGMNDYLPKPIIPESLKELARKWATP